MNTENTKIIHELVKQKEIYNTKITVYVEGTDTVLYEGSNKIILPGAINTACKHWGFDAPYTLPNYNSALGIEEENLNLTATENEQNKFIVLFCVGTDGCGPESSQVYPVNFAKWINEDNIIPFQYRHKNNDLDPADRQIYFGRKVIGDYIAYYFKAFHTKPELKIQYIDGTPISSNIYNVESEIPVEAFVETKLKITKNDLRDYFERTVGLNEARVSSISLLTGVPVSSADGYIYYRDVQPMTKYNFSVENLSDLTKGLDITYQVYY